MHRLSAAFEGGAHHLDGLEVAADGCKRGDLCDVRNVRRGVRLEVDRGLHHVVGADHPADSPSGHRIGLCDAVHDDALVGHLRHEGRHRRKRVGAIGEMFVDLVGDHPDAVVGGPLADGGDLLGRVHRAAGVVGRDEQQNLGARCLRALELFHRHSETHLFGGVDDDGDSARKDDGFGIGRPVRRGTDDLVTRVAQRRERDEHRVLAAIRHQHLTRLAVESAVALGLHRDRLAQFGQAGRGRVAVVLHLVAGLCRSLDDVGGRRKVRFPRAETDDVLTLGLQRLRLGVDGQRCGLCDCGEAGRNPRFCWGGHG